jgi:hypothetical protein
MLRIVPLEEVVVYNLDYTWRHFESTFVKLLEERDSLAKDSQNGRLVEGRMSS